MKNIINISFAAVIILAVAISVTPLLQPDEIVYSNSKHFDSIIAESYMEIHSESTVASLTNLDSIENKDVQAKAIVQNLKDTISRQKPIISFASDDFKRLILSMKR